MYNNLVIILGLRALFEEVLVERLMFDWVGGHTNSERVVRLSLKTSPQQHVNQTHSIFVEFLPVA